MPAHQINCTSTAPVIVHKADDLLIQVPEIDMALSILQIIRIAFKAITASQIACALITSTPGMGNAITTCLEGIPVSVDVLPEVDLRYAAWVFDVPQLVVVGIANELASHVATVTSVVVALKRYISFLLTVIHDVEAHG